MHRKIRYDITADSKEIRLTLTLPNKPEPRKWLHDLVATRIANAGPFVSSIYKLCGTSNKRILGWFEPRFKTAEEFNALFAKPVPAEPYDAGWQTGHPLYCGYYLATWKDAGGHSTVSELWFNPDSPTTQKKFYMKTFQEVYHNDPLVHRMHRDGMSDRDIICAMAERHEEMAKRLGDQDLLLPKRFVFSDGVEASYRAPLPSHSLRRDQWPLHGVQKSRAEARRELKTSVIERPHKRDWVLTSYAPGYHEPYTEEFEFQPRGGDVVKAHQARALQAFDLREQAANARRKP